MNGFLKPQGIVLYTEGATLFASYPDSQRESWQARVLLKNILNWKNVKVSKDRATVVAVVNEQDRYAIYLLRARADWQPIRIVEDCRPWPPANSIFTDDWGLADDGSAIWTKDSECSVFLEPDGWKRVTINTGDWRTRVSDNGRTFAASTGRREPGIIVWDAWHKWEPRLVRVVPHLRDYPYSPWKEYALGSSSGVVIASGYSLRAKKFRLFLADQTHGKRSQAIVWESPDEIHIHAAAESNDSVIFSTNKELSSCSVYGIRRASRWKPELIFTAGRYVQRVEYVSPSGDLFVLSLQERGHPGAGSKVLYDTGYAVTLQNDTWMSQRILPDIPDLGIYGFAPSPLVAVAPDQHHIAGICEREVEGEFEANIAGKPVLRCVTPEGEVVGEWPAAIGRIEFSPDAQWLTYVLETGGEGRRLARRIDGSGEFELFRYSRQRYARRRYVGWVKSATESQPKETELKE